MPTFLRAWLSLCACRSQGVSSNITLFRSWFFSSGLSSAGVFFHCSKMRWILGSLLAIERARAFAYSRLNTCSEHSYGYSIRYGRATAAHHARFADRQWQRFCNQDAAGEHWHCPLLAVGDAGRRRHRLVGQETATVRHRDAPAETPRFFRWDVEILLGLRVSEQLVRPFVVEGLFERKPHRPALRSVGLVGDFDAELHRVAFAQETGRVGLDHQVLRGDSVGLKVAAAH